MRLALTLWSGAHGPDGRRSSSLAVLVLARIGVGTFEAPCFPANSRILATWFPQAERARANARSIRWASTSASGSSACRSSGLRSSSAGAAYSSSSAASALCSWRSSGGPCIATRTRPGRQEPRLDNIEAGGGGEYKGRNRSTSSGSYICALLKTPAGPRRLARPVRRQLDPVFFLTWFPTYLVPARGMTFIQAGVNDGAAVHRGLGGRAGRPASCPSAILKRTGSANAARKLPIVGGLLLFAPRSSSANYAPGRQPTRWSS